MAENKRIDDIISEKAFQQLDLLVEKLGKSQSEFAEMAKKASELNTEISKSKDFDGFNKAVEQANRQIEELNKKEQESIKIKNKLVSEEKKAVEVVKGSLLGKKEETKLLNSLNGSLEQNIRANLRLKNELKTVREEQKRLNSQMTGSNKITSELSRRKEALAIRENELKTAVTASNLEIRRATKENQAAEGSLDEMAARLDQLRGAYRSLNKEQRENVEIGGSLLASISEYDKALKEADAAQGVFNRNVGNYSNEVQDAFEKTGIFSNEMQILGQAQQLYIIGAKGAKLATQSFSKALIATGIGAIIIALGSLVALLTATQKGMDFVGQVTESVSAVLGTFVDALSDTGESIANQIIPIFDALVKNITGLYDILMGVINLDFNRVLDGTKAVGESFTDLVDAGSKIEGIDLIGLGNDAAFAAKEAFRLRGALQDIEREQKNVDLLRSESRARIEELKFIAEDQSKSEKERSAAAREALTIEQELLQKRIDLKARELEAEKALNNLTKSDDSDRNREIDIQIELNELREESTTKQIELNNKLNELQRSAEAKRIAAAKEAEAEKQKIADAAFSLEQSRLTRSAERSKEVFENEKNAYQDRISNLESYLKTEEERIILARDKELSAKNILESDKIRITEEAQAEIERLRKQGADRANEILLNEVERSKDANSQRLKNEVDSIKQAEAERLIALNGRFSSGAMTEKEYQAERLRINQDTNNKILEQEINAVQALIDINKKRGISTIEQERQLAELRLKLSEQGREKQIADIEKVAEREAEIAEKRKELSAEIADLAVSIINQGYEDQINKLKQQNDLIDTNKAKEIERINETAESEEKKAAKIAIIEARAQAQKEENDRKAKQVQAEQARFQKAISVARIIQNTAAGVMAALASVPPNIPLSILIGAIGSAQLAKVATTKIPAFEKGTDNSPEGFALVGEKGVEGRIDPDGGFSLTPGKPTVTYLKKGTQIIPNNEIKKSLSYEKGNNAGKSWEIDKMLIDEISGLKKAYSEKPSTNVLINKGGMSYVYNKGKNRTNYINKKI